MSDYNFFSQGSPYLQHPLLTPERTAGEIDFLMQQMALPSGARILDVGCGFGRHTIELGGRGFEVTGLDPAAAMIDSARKNAAAAGINAEFRQVRAEDFWTETPFQAAICLFTTLGQVTAKGTSGSGLVASVHRALAPGSLFAVEVPQREPAVRQLEASETYGQGEYYTQVTRHFHPADNTVGEQFLVVSPQRRRTYQLRYRLYSRGEVDDLLESAGFIVQSWFGNYAGEPLRANDTTMLVFAKAV